MPRPAAAFQRTSQRSRSTASRFEQSSSARNTITTAITEPGTNGLPRGPNRSACNHRTTSAGCSGQEPIQRLLAYQSPAQAHASNSPRSGFSVPYMPPILPHPPRSRAPWPESAAVSWSACNSKADCAGQHRGRTASTMPGLIFSGTPAQPADPGRRVFEPTGRPDASGPGRASSPARKLGVREVATDRAHPLT